MRLSFGRDSKRLRAVADAAERTLFLNGQIAARCQPRDRRIRNLSEVEFRVYSQWGEDGIIEWLVGQVDPPNQRFIEFGVEDFREANCRFLMRNRGWKGLVMDGSAANMQAVAAEPDYWMHDLSPKTAFVTAENINGLIADAGFVGEIGLLSIDVDGNDYWIWKAIDCVDAAVVSCEFNAVLGDRHPITIPYEPSFSHLSAHHSGQYFGASIAALICLAGAKGYRFVGTNSNGVNAFFVREAFAAQVLARMDEVRAFPSRHRDSRDQSGALSYVSGSRRLALIADMPVVDLSIGSTLRLGDIEQPYSDEWLRGME